MPDLDVYRSIVDLARLVGLRLAGGWLRGCLRVQNQDGSLALQRVAERLDAGNIVCLFADGGWKYLSTQLWTTNYEDLPSDIEDKIWW